MNKDDIEAHFRSHGIGPLMGEVGESGKMIACVSDRYHMNFMVAGSLLYFRLSSPGGLFKPLISPATLHTSDYTFNTSHFTTPSSFPPTLHTSDYTFNTNHFLHPYFGLASESSGGKSWPLTAVGEVDVRLACIISGFCVEAGGSSVLKLNAVFMNGCAGELRRILGISAFWWVLPVDCGNRGLIG
jgi:hypothetical protein